jgi:hypothetical protein
MQLATPQALALDANSHSHSLARVAYRIHILQHVVTDHPEPCQTAAGSLSIQLRQKRHTGEKAGNSAARLKPIAQAVAAGYVARARVCASADWATIKGARTCILHAMSMKYIRTNASAMLQEAVTEHSQRAAPFPRTQHTCCPASAARGCAASGTCFSGRD